MIHACVYVGGLSGGSQTLTTCACPPLSRVMYVCTYMYVCMYIYVWIYMYVCMYVYICMDIYVCICMDIHTGEPTGEPTGQPQPTGEPSLLTGEPTPTNYDIYV